jgi:NAD(P)-dependent dehydrogenase (short-subunit alcohol dehydrogenase family)
MTESPLASQSRRSSSSGERWAVVTGGTSGIGKAIASQLLADDTLKCLLTGKKLESDIVLPARCEYFQVDLSNRSRVRELADELRELRPTILVNQAGDRRGSPTVELALADFDYVMDVNLRAPFALMQAVLPGMIDANHGRIVNITSIFSVVGNDENAAYCASKFGLDGVTASIAAEVAVHNVLVNSVAPGFVERGPGAYPNGLKNRIPRRKFVTTQDIASLVSWLVSDMNQQVTGQNIVMDGGFLRSA